jgi:hypothetical protein
MLPYGDKQSLDEICRWMSATRMNVWDAVPGYAPKFPLQHGYPETGALIFFTTRLFLSDENENKISLRKRPYRRLMDRRPVIYPPFQRATTTSIWEL